ncbi:hypothetical protein DL767_009781 [Monosporascus sp. MG133]|nr:hypothetical protein DL767_009781 [Monosporascus sp. MG133]
MTYDAATEMAYLRYVLQETAWRTRIRVLPVGGGPEGRSPLFVGKNDAVTYSTFVMHRRRQCFGNEADGFRPGRWVEARLRPGWEFLPFNGGPRICPGQKFTPGRVVLHRRAPAARLLGRREPGPDRVEGIDDALADAEQWRAVPLDSGRMEPSQYLTRWSTRVE